MFYSIFAVFLVLLLVVLIVKRPRLRSNAPASTVPDNLSLTELDQWVKHSESKTLDIVDGAEAMIEFADSTAPIKTSVCFLYVHGFSASRQETAPVTSEIASHYDANVFHARLAGHGVGSAGMVTSAESWLQSMVDAWKVAEYLGDEVVIVATSTGAPLTVWLLKQLGVAKKVTAVLLMSPNFKIKNPFGFLLTWPLSPYWVHLLLGRNHSWEPESPVHAKVWTSSYSTLAVIEMQKVVDWAGRTDLGSIQTPLAMMCMKNDPTVNASAAESAFERWGAAMKSHIPIRQNSDNAEHVFTGHLAGPYRTDDTVEAFSAFLKPIIV